MSGLTRQGRALEKESECWRGEAETFSHLPTVHGPAGSVAAGKEALGSPGSSCSYRKKTLGLQSSHAHLPKSIMCSSLRCGRGPARGTRRVAREPNLL